MRIADYLKYATLLFFLQAVIYPMLLSAQDNDTTFLSREEIDINEFAIEKYDYYNILIGGDSIRTCGLKLCDGWVSDYYPSGALLHKGFYKAGRLSNIYSNYYENGVTERSFKIKDPVKSIMEVYYPNGKLQSRTHYYKGGAIKTEEFYPDGKPEFEEEMDKRFEYYIKFNFYYPDGSPHSIMELDPGKKKKQKVYSCRIYYPNGKISEEGKSILNRALNDYQRFGFWKIYDSSGKLLREDYYVKGALADPSED